jgi:hypothetical protein
MSTQARAAALYSSGGLSRNGVMAGETHTPKLGTRSLDVLYLACALELKLRQFLTFDLRQQHLAAAVGLRIVQL